jgi:predicted nucleic acid-binding protein
VILADTGVWIDYFRRGNQEMQRLLNNAQITMHPFIAAELALGSLHDRQRTLTELERLSPVRVARSSEVRHMIEHHSLYSRGIGLIDAFLMASCLITQPTQLWTRDNKLGSVARNLGISANLP